MQNNKPQLDQTDKASQQPAEGASMDEAIKAFQNLMVSAMSSAMSDALKSAMSSVTEAPKGQSLTPAENVPNQTPSKQAVDKEIRRQQLQKKPTNPSRIYGKDWVVMQNELLYAISNLELDERRLIMYLSPLVRKVVSQNPEQRTFFVYAKEFAEVSGIDPKNAYGKLASITESMLNKSFTLWNFDKDEKENKADKRGISWIAECEYVSGEGYLEVELTSTMVRMLTVFDEEHPYTKYQRWLIVNMTSYGIILFELIMSCMYQSHKEKKFSVAYLREKFGCIETYPNIAEFKRNVIDKAIIQVEENTPARVSYTQKKVGRNVTDLIFTFEDTSGGSLVSGMTQNNETQAFSESVRQNLVYDSSIPEGYEDADFAETVDFTEGVSEVSSLSESNFYTNEQVHSALEGLGAELDDDFEPALFTEAQSKVDAPNIKPQARASGDNNESLDLTNFPAFTKKVELSDLPDPEYDTPDMFDDMFVSKRQRYAFACKLARLPELAYLAKNEAKRDYGLFASQIMNELVDPERQRFYKPYLDMLGFESLK